MKSVLFQHIMHLKYTCKQYTLCINSGMYARIVSTKYEPYRIKTALIINNVELRQYRVGTMLYMNNVELEFEVISIIPLRKLESVFS